MAGLVVTVNVNGKPHAERKCARCDSIGVVPGSRLCNNHCLLFEQARIDIDAMDVDGCGAYIGLDEDGTVTIDGDCTLAELRALVVILERLHAA